MYGFLCKYIPAWLANAVMFVWYLALLVLIFVLSVEQEAGFLYKNL